MKKLKNVVLFLAIIFSTGLNSNAQFVAHNLADIIEAAQTDFKNIIGEKVSDDTAKSIIYRSQIKFYLEGDVDYIQMEKKDELYFFSSYFMDKKNAQYNAGLKMIALMQKYFLSEKSNSDDILTETIEGTYIIKRVMDLNGNLKLKTVKNTIGKKEFIVFVFGKTHSLYNISFQSTALHFLHAAETNFEEMKGQDSIISEGTTRYSMKEYFGAGEEAIVKEKDGFYFTYAYFDNTNKVDKKNGKIAVEEVMKIINALTPKIPTAKYKKEIEIIGKKKVTRLKDKNDNVLLAIILDGILSSKIEIYGESFKQH